MLPASARPTALALAAALLALLPAGCGKGPPPPRTGAPVGYEALRERIAPQDFAPLRGRRILLDPGHGGFFRGAVADNGLAEADVNLDVALRLRGLLEWAGAEVAMTRTADYDFLAGTDSTVAADLAFRVAMMDSMQPDAFISLHHNSNADRDPDRNETQTYYPLGDDGASRDLARAIHRHLALNLDIRPARLLPGNFHVLRHATAPAALGEPAMISHPGVARRLTLAEARRLEAEAYFLGLRAYFAGGAPAWRAAQPETLVAAPAGCDLEWTFVPDRDGLNAPGPAPSSFVLTRDGARVAPALSADGATVRWREAAADAGAAVAPVVLELRGENRAGRAAPVARTVLLPPRGTRLLLTARPDGRGGALLGWEAPPGQALPRGALVWPDGHRVPVDPHAPRDALVADARAGATVAFAPADPVAPPVTVVWAPPVPLPDAWHWHATPAPATGGPWRARDLDGADPAPAAGRTAVPVRDDRAWWWSAPGRRPRLPDAAAMAPDYGDPVLPALEGRTVVLDAAGDGGRPDGTGPTGLTGAAVNRGTVVRLARLLEAAGAHAVLAAPGPVAVRPDAKVALAGRAGADLFLTVGRAAAGAPARVLHHPGSGVGTPWAAATAAALTRLGADSVGVAPSWGYLLRHTACPALEVRLPHAATIADERRLEDPRWQAAEARALLAGLAATLAAPDTVPLADPAAVLARLAGAPPPALVDWALWDGELPWTPLPGPGTDPAPAVDSWREPGLPAVGPLHTLEVHAGGAWQLWLIDRTSPGGDRLLLEGSDADAPAVP